MSKATKIDLLRLDVAMVLLEPWIFLGNFVVWGFIALAPLLVGTSLAMAIDSLSVRGGEGFVANATLYAFVAIGGAALTWLGGIADAATRTSVTIALRKRVLSSLLGASHHELSIANGIELVNNDLQPLTDLVSNQIDLFFRVTFAIVAVVVLFLTNPWIALVAVLPTTILVSGLALLRESVKSRHRDVRRVHVDYTQLLTEIMDAHETIQMSGTTDKIVDHYTTVAEMRRKEVVAQARFTKLLEGLSPLGVSLGCIIVLITSTVGFGGAQLSSGQIALFVAYLAYLGNFTEIFGELVGLYKYTQNGVERIASTLRLPVRKVVEILSASDEHDVEVTSYNQPSSVAVEFRNFGPTTSVTRISVVALAPGEILAIRGNFNQSVSQFISCFAGLVPATGEIRGGDGVVLVNEDITVLSAEPQVWADDIVGNVTLNAAPLLHTLEESLAIACIQDEVTAWCADGRESDLGEANLRISQGQQQRLALARAIYQARRLLVLEEPTSHVQKELASKMLANLSSLRVPIVVCSNDPSVANVAKVCIEAD